MKGDRKRQAKIVAAIAAEALAELQEEEKVRMQEANAKTPEQEREEQAGEVGHADQGEGPIQDREAGPLARGGS